MQLRESLTTRAEAMEPQAKYDAAVRAVLIPRDQFKGQCEIHRGEQWRGKRMSGEGRGMVALDILTSGRILGVQKRAMWMF